MITFEENILLAPFTSFHIGGSARYFVRVKSIEEAIEALTFAKTENLPVFILGGGSNILVADTGFKGVVIKVENEDVTGDGQMIAVGAGATLLSVVAFAVSRGLKGLENLAGIPGLIGGAVRGNAGAFGTDIGTHIISVMAFNRDTFETKVFTHQECQFSYRDSFFKQHPEWAIFGVGIGLELGDAEELQKITDETIAKREAKHPQNAWSAGSFFVNPVVTDAVLRKEFETDTGIKLRDDKVPAGWLIDQVGLRGKKISGAMVSEIHPNYIVNTGAATAEDIIILSSLIKQKVRTQLNVQLKEEAQLVGF